MNLKSIREKKGVSQFEIAKYLGVVRSTICQYENGKRKPDPETLIKLANFFGVSTDYLLGRSDDFGNVTINGIAPALSDEERELLALFRKMTNSQKVRFVGYGEGLIGVPMGKNA